MGVFADSFDFIALLNSADQFHAASKRATHAIAGALVTTWFLVEVADALSAPGYRGHVRRSLQRGDADPNATVLPAETA